MALETKMISPDGATTISLKDARVSMRIPRKITNTETANNQTVGLDLRRAKRIFTITGTVTVEGASSAKAQVEAIENAAMNWPAQFGANGNRTKLVWGTKSTGGDKFYLGYITNCEIVNAPKETGGTGTIYDFTITFEEVGSLSTSGG